MRSKLIDEIFSVEEQAVKIVNDAKEQKKSYLATKEQEGQLLFQNGLNEEKAKSNRELEKNQKEATSQIDAFQKSLAKKENDKRPLQQCAEKVAEKMVELLTTTSLGGS
ncbi:MAG: hypothetical protein WDA17_05285 [Sphaerochaetaceae bacterium]|jgi:vacuolar-type H+-ATPase subunit H